MANTRELSQLASLINVVDENKSIGIVTSYPNAYVGIGSMIPAAKVDVAGDALVSGIVSATSFYGDGSNLSGLSTFSGNYDDLINTPEIPSLVGYATEGYVDASITNLVDSAPGALDTLNELAAALGDDSNFSTTVTNSLASKADLSGANFTGVVTATSFYGDGSNLSNIISGVGIQSAGNAIGTGITTLNFIGAGNTFAVNGTTVDISIAGGGGGASVSISTEAPSNPSEGDLWYNSILGRTFIYYNDDSSSQWVDSAPFNSATVDDDLTLSTLTVTNIVASGIVTAADFDSSSDLNLKENVQVIENAIDKLVGISGVTFEWKETKQVSAGVIAQDVEKVFPEVVKTNEYKTVNYNGLIGLLVESIKEQQKQIDELKSRIDVLES